MLKIRMLRLGKKDQPHFRIVVIESTKKRNGKYIDIVGNYTPGTTNRVVNVKQELLDSWINKGAQMSPSVRNLLKTIAKEKAIAENPQPTIKEKVTRVKKTKVESKDSGKKKEKEL